MEGLTHITDQGGIFLGPSQTSMRELLVVNYFG